MIRTSPLVREEVNRVAVKMGKKAVGRTRRCGALFGLILGLGYEVGC